MLKSGRRVVIETVLQDRPRREEILVSLFKQCRHEESSCLSYQLGCTRTGVAAIVEPQLEI